MWPEASKSAHANPSKQDKARARQQARRAEWNAEIDRLHRKRDERSNSALRERLSAQNEAKLCRIHDAIRSKEFREWYEATTGELPDAWMDWVIAPDWGMSARGYGALGETQLAWTEAQIRMLSESHRWTDPEVRAMWAKEVAECQETKRRRMILIRLATPRWANKERIAEIYRLRAKMTADTGIDHDVDHIVPLVHPKVCGLHWEGNLRVVPASENRRKSNFFDPAAYIA